MTPDGLRVVNPEAAGCCAAHPSDLVTVRPREDDAGRLWFFTSWRQPVAEVDRVTDAVMALRTLLNGRPGRSL